MPTYEYRCRDCSNEFELFQRMSDEPVASCPRCSGPAERLLSAGAGLLFKGDGFYITDYRSDSYKKEAGKETPGKETPSSVGDSGSGSDRGDTSVTSGKSGTSGKDDPSGSGASSGPRGTGSGGDD